MSDWLVGVAALLTTLVGVGDEDVECLRLGALDAVRVEALATGRPEGLTAVYATPQGADADRALLAEYDDRMLRLRGGAMQRLECRVTARTEERVEIDVVDRLGRTWVEDDDGRRRELPRAAARQRAVTLTLTPAGWRVARAE